MPMCGAHTRPRAGGVPCTLSWGTVARLLAGRATLIGPAMDRLSMTFAHRTPTPPSGRPIRRSPGAWSAEVDAYIQRDLMGEGGQLRSTCRIEAVRTDGIGLFDGEVLRAVRGLPCPATLLWARRGLMDEEQGL